MEPLSKNFANVAQLVEHNFPKVEVTGSYPVVRSRKEGTSDWSVTGLEIPGCRKARGSIPLPSANNWRNGRVVEGDGFENRCRRKSTVGSNPTSSANCNMSKGLYEYCPHQIKS